MLHDYLLPNWRYAKEVLLPLLCCIPCVVAFAVWLQDPQPYFGRFPQANILATSDAVAPSRDDGNLDDPQVIGRADLNIGQLTTHATWVPPDRMSSCAAALQSNVGMKACC